MRERAGRECVTARVEQENTRLEGKQYVDTSCDLCLLIDSF